MVQKGNLAIFLRPAKGEKSLKLERSHPPKLFCIYFTSTSMCIIFLSRNLALLEANEMGEKISSRRGHAHKNFVCMYFTSTPTCINFLNHFYFWPGSKWKFEWNWRKRPISPRLEWQCPPNLLHVNTLSVSTFWIFSLFHILG